MTKVPRTRRRTLLTPEGVPLSLTVADAGQRLGAFLLDLVGMAAALLALSLLALAIIGAAHDDQIAVVLWVIGFFLLRNLYFAAFELTPRAATPAKRLLGLRGAARDGGRLTGNAILARNLVRELELFLPLTMLALRGTNADGWLIVLGFGWTGLFLFFPLLNRDRLRVGDLLAGTWVVQEPRVRLLPDLAGDSGPALRFSRAQLAAYGIKELHVLEDVLRQREPAAMGVVADGIRARIGWVRGSEGENEFLSAYYAALRQELERGLLFGRRKQDKNDRG